MRLHSIKRIAQAKGISQTQLSHKTYLNPRTIAKLWRDEDDVDINIELDTIAKIAEALGVKVTDLIVEEATA